MSIPQFTDAQGICLQKILEQCQGDYSIDSLHASISAMLACNHAHTYRDLLANDLIPKDLFDAHTGENNDTGKEHPADALFSYIHYSLVNTEFSYQLPDYTNDSMIEKITRLVQWCESFSFALGIFIQKTYIDSDVHAICNALANMQAFSVKEYEKQGVDEEDLEQIIEYFRMGVIYIHSLHHASEKPIAS